MPAIETSARDPRGSADSAYWLAVGLDRLPPLIATALACEWALAERADRRLTLARALAWTFRLLGDSVMIDHLSRDGDDRVRAAAAKAARARRPVGGDDGVLGRLVGDPHDAVRRAAGGR